MQFYWMFICMSWFCLLTTLICPAKDLDNIAQYARHQAPFIPPTEIPPHLIANTLRKDVYLRAAYLFLIFFPVSITSIFAFFSVWFREVIWFKLLQITVAYSGAAFVKWGQWASTRSDMFPDSLCRALSVLQDQSPAHGYDFTRHQIETAFGKPLEQIFSAFDPIPIASGSIAQVYRATWEGKEVAVKVRHPGVETQIKLDFLIIASVAKFLDGFSSLSWLRLSESVAQFSDKIAAQTDLNLEASQLLKFNEFFQSWNSVVQFPKPMLSKESVIIETFIDGSNVANIIKLRQEETYESLDTAYFIVTKGEEIYLKMLIIDNFMHADLHPGNILVHEIRDFEEKSIVKRKIGLVDAGMVAVLTLDQQRNFIGLLEAVGEGNGDEAAHCVMNFSPHEIDERTRFLFTQEMIQVFQRVAKGYGQNVSLGIVLREILTLLRQHHITIEANYATLVLNMLCLDGMAHSLLPTYNILDGAKILLQFHRRVKNLPGMVAAFVKKLSLPLLMWVKKKADQRFLSQLKALSLQDIAQIYKQRKKFVV